MLAIRCRIWFCLKNMACIHLFLNFSKFSVHVRVNLWNKVGGARLIQHPHPKSWGCCSTHSTPCSRLITFLLLTLRLKNWMQLLNLVWLPAWDFWKVIALIGCTHKLWSYARITLYSGEKRLDIIILPIMAYLALHLCCRLGTQLGTRLVYLTLFLI